MNYTLTANTRTTKPTHVRAAGQIPAVVYGGKNETVSLAVDYNVFTKMYAAAGESSLMDLMVDGKEAGKVLVADVQHDPMTGRIVHFDVRRIDMSKPITAMVELKFVGEAPIIKASGGTLMTTVSAVEVKCLPKDLPSGIEVDVSVLKNFEDSIKVENLALPPGVQIVNHQAHDLVAKAQVALTEEQIKAMEEAGPQSVEDIASAKPVKEGEEGEAAAGADGAAAPAAPEAKKEEKK